MTEQEKTELIKKAFQQTINIDLTTPKIDELNLEDQIAEINSKLIELDEEKAKLIQLQTQLEMEKRYAESKAAAERITKARGKSSHKKILGRKNAKFGLINSIKEQRRIRKERLSDSKDS